jgi:hypothetical protein
MEPNNRVVICGETQYDVARWTALAVEFNFDLEFIPEISNLAELSEPHGVSSVVIRLDESGRNAADATNHIRTLAPNARVILSRPMASHISSADLNEAGVFHSIRQPMHASEMRQSLGFLWSALNQDAANKKEAGPATADISSAADEPTSTVDSGVTPDLATSR